MQLVKEQGDEQRVISRHDSPLEEIPNHPQESDGHDARLSIPFEKNYPKNLFIPMIEHLSEMGLQKEYQQQVGTRESFEGKNVVSLPQIYEVISQRWFVEKINTTVLVSNMSNKILMNSKIKKKLFHLLLIKQLFTVPRQNGREFKKLVSKKANQICTYKFPHDELFEFPSAIIYLLSIFLKCLIGKEQKSAGQGGSQEQMKKYYYPSDNSGQSRPKNKQTSSKEQYKFYISKIINRFNQHQQMQSDLFDTLDTVRNYILQRQSDVRQKYGLSQFVPCWMHFNTIVVNNCFQNKKNKIKLTYSIVNHWIQEFRELSTSVKGFTQNQQDKKSSHKQFEPIILIDPPKY